MAERRSVIVTFKPKDERPDQDRDKLDVLREVTDAPMQFLSASSVPAGAGLPVGVPDEMVVYDVDEFSAPIVTAYLTQDEIDALNANDNVVAVEEDGECYALGHADVGSTHRQNLIQVEGQPSALAETLPAGIAQIKAPLAWEGSQGKGINVAVLDTGIDRTHPDLALNYKGGVSFVPGEPTPEDFNSHGTHCAGTIAARINGAGVVGVAPAASLYAVKVLSRTGSGSWSNLIAGIDWCIKNRMRVLSMSLGGASAPAALEAMCKLAWNRGLLLVAAAGNTGAAVGVPALYDSVIAVSAIDNANTIAPFSSRGPKVELSAPGVAVLSTIPGGAYGTKSGTSMACPHVAGSAALAWGGHRYNDNVTIRRLLAWTSDNLGVPGRDPLYGFGRVDAEQATLELAVPPAIPGIP